MDTVTVILLSVFVAGGVMFLIQQVGELRNHIRRTAFLGKMYLAFANQGIVVEDMELNNTVLSGRVGATHWGINIKVPLHRIDHERLAITAMHLFNLKATGVKV